MLGEKFAIDAADCDAFGLKMKVLACILPFHFSSQGNYCFLNMIDFIVVASYLLTLFVPFRQFHYNWIGEQSFIIK